MQNRRRTQKKSNHFVGFFRVCFRLRENDEVVYLIIYASADSSFNVGLMLGHRRRRWSNIRPTLSIGVDEIVIKLMLVFLINIVDSG